MDKFQTYVILIWKCYLKVLIFSYIRYETKILLKELLSDDMLYIMEKYKNIESLEWFYISNSIRF